METPETSCCSTPNCCSGKKKCLLCGIVAIAVLLLVATLTFFLGKQFGLKQVPLCSPCPVCEQPSKSDQTANWKTYINKKYGFETKYNPDNKATEGSGGGETVGQFTYLLTVTFSSGGSNPWHSQNGYEVEINKKSLTDYRTEIVGHVADKIDSEQAITTNGNIWTKIDYKIFVATDYIPMTKAVINHDGYGYAVTAVALDIDQILSTFRFD